MNKKKRGELKLDNEDDILDKTEDEPVILGGDKKSIVNENTLSDLVSLLIEYTILVISSMLDCIELSFANMTYASGKNLKYVVLIVLSYLPISVIVTFFGYSPVIKWQDSLCACIVILVIWSINGITDASVNKMVSDLRNVKQGVKKHGK